MSSAIALTERERNLLLDSYRAHSDPTLRLRCQIILLLAAGYPWSLITAVLFCSSHTVARWQQPLAKGRVAALLDAPRGRPSPFAVLWIELAVAWILEKAPREFGLYRSPWC
jgi:hypothetical protein